MKQSRLFQIARLSAFLVLLPSLMIGCVTRGKNFSSDTAWLDENNPNQSQVHKIMGSPFKVGSSNGTKTWTYGYYKHSLFGESHTKELKIYWKDTKDIKSYSFSSSFPKDVKL